MSPTELLVLEKGRIPARIVLDEIRTYIDEVYDESDLYGDNIGPVRALAERSGVSLDALTKWIGQGVHSIAFDDADKLFCAMGRYHLWLTRYRDYYYACDLSWTKCACPGCEVTFKSGRAQQGPTVKRYCSKACQTAAAKIRDGITSRRHKRYSDPIVCRNGHEKTPENTKLRRDGRSECLICARESARRFRARQAA